MTSINSNPYSDYYKETAVKAGFSFAISGALATLMTGNLVTGVLIGTAAALITVIADFVKPFFQGLWGNPTSESWIQRNVRQSTVIGAVGLAAGTLLSVPVAVLPAVALSVIVDIFNNQFNNTSWKSSGYTILV